MEMPVKWTGTKAMTEKATAESREARPGQPKAKGPRGCKPKARGRKEAR